MPEFLWYPLGLSLQIAGAVVLAVLATRIVEWPFLRWRERIPYLRDDKPLLASRGQLDMKGTATECM
jgi:peptidoglycan/LPS O-acetylase OafA/YrhL